ncbi:MAG: HD domain-containing protein, partial [Clostridia bacterium]|nr:HD domain-containing protein [Clostridia bacterium]
FCAAAKACGAEITAVYRNTGTVKVKLKKEEYEFACFRSDEYVRGTHTPVKIFFTNDITLDALRRDFKCNAVYYEINKDELSDPLGGIGDIKNKIITTVNRAEKVFGEDGLRLMRLARQAAQTGFTPSEDCLDGAVANCALISDIAPERIFAELNAILHADEKYGKDGAQYVGLKLLESTGVLAFILPELWLGKGMSQPEKFHSHDVLEHSLRTVLYADKRVRLAALLHDIGKPYLMTEQGNFYGHENVGAKIAQEVCLRLKTSKKLMEEAVKLTALHMYDMRLDARESKIRRFIVRNLAYFEKLLLIKQADYSACRDDLNEAPCVTKWKRIYACMKEEGVPMQLKQLAVRGDELIGLGVPPDTVGKALWEMLENCAACGLENDKERLLKYAGKFIEQRG